jgi:hypothetical protein
LIFWFFERETADQALSAAAPGDTQLFGGKHQVRFALLRSRSHGIVAKRTSFQ